MMGLCLNKPIYQGGIRPSIRITMTICAVNRIYVPFMTVHYNETGNIVKGYDVFWNAIVSWLTHIGACIQSVSAHPITWK
jgi:hypothetical protein